MKTNSSPRCFASETHLPRLIAIILLAGLFLCLKSWGQGISQPPVVPAGVYELVSVEGMSVPCTLKHEKQTLLIQSGSFTLTNGECFSRMIISHGTNTNIVCNTRAKFAIQEGALDLRWSNGGKTRATVDGDTLTMKNEGMLLVFRKPPHP